MKASWSAREAAAIKSFQAGRLPEGRGGSTWSRKCGSPSKSTQNRRKKKKPKKHEKTLKNAMDIVEKRTQKAWKKGRNGRLHHLLLARRLHDAQLPGERPRQPLRVGRRLRRLQQLDRAQELRGQAWGACS